jgi:hypothetical protein
MIGFPAYIDEIVRIDVLIMQRNDYEESQRGIDFAANRLYATTPENARRSIRRVGSP